MNSHEKQIRTESERIRLSKVEINEYMNREQIEMNQEYVDEVKNNGNAKDFSAKSKRIGSME